LFWVGFVPRGLVTGEDGGAIGWIREIVLDCADPWCLARFWAGLLGGTPAEWHLGWVTLEPPPHGQRMSFQGTADMPAAHARKCTSMSWRLTWLPLMTESAWQARRSPPNTSSHGLVPAASQSLARLTGDP
jgi:hypothetical protein